MLLALLDEVPQTDAVHELMETDRNTDKKLQNPAAGDELQLEKDGCGF